MFAPVTTVPNELKKTIKFNTAYGFALMVVYISKLDGDIYGGPVKFTATFGYDHWCCKIAGTCLRERALHKHTSTTTRIAGGLISPCKGGNKIHEVFELPFFRNHRLGYGS